jgi:hypothetical protein
LGYFDEKDFVIDESEEEDDEQPEGAGLNIFVGTLTFPLPLNLKLLFASRDKNFASPLTFEIMLDVLEVTRALCCSKTMAVFRALFSSFFVVVVVVTRLKL